MKTPVDERPAGMTCETALDGEALTAYVAGRLGEAEAEAFEAHYFSCDECWSLLQAANAAQASFAEEHRAAAPGAPAISPQRARRLRWTTLAPLAALAAALAGVALWRAETPEAPEEVFRGAEQSMSLEVVVEEATLRAAWAPIVGAAGYELRLYDAGGRLLRASEVDGQTVAVDIDVLELGGAPSVAAMEVVALDGLGQVLLRSQRVALRP